MNHRSHTNLIVCALLVLSAPLALCGADPLPLGFPEIQIEPPSLGVDVTTGGSTSTSFLVRNTGDGVLIVYTIDDDAAWMTEDPTSFSVPSNGAQTVTVQVDASGLPAGIYDQTIAVSCNDVDEPDVSIPIRVNVTGAQVPDITVHPSSLTATVPAGSTTQALLTVLNTGTATLVVSSITDDATWMSENPEAFSVAPGDSQTVTVNIDATTLTPDTYSRQITIQSNDPDENPVTVQVTVTVTQTPEPDIWVHPTTITVTIPSGQSTTETLMVGNGGSANLVVSSVTDDATWITVTPTSFTVAPGDSQSVTVEIQANTGAGAYNATVTIASNDPDEATVQITVSETTGARPWEPGPELTLHSPVPNPFTDTTELQFELTRASTVELTVHDISGRAVATLEHGTCAPGSHVARWTGTDASGQRVAPGLYTVRLQAGDAERVVWAVLIR